LLQICHICRAFLSDTGANVLIMEEKWTPRRQGDAGELSAMMWFVEAGASVGIPLLNHSDYDLLADWGDRVERVQVKTSSCRVGDRFLVQLSTRGGNQSWSRTIKYLDASRCDSLLSTWRTAGAGTSRRRLLEVGQG
jgi:hypothetical protein